MRHRAHAARGGALQPTQQAILRQTFPPEEQGMAMAIYSMVVMIGPAVGPVLGGWITDNYSWPWIFYINLPVGLLGIIVTIQNVREYEDVRIANRVRAELARKNLDLAGIALMVVGTGALQYLFEEGPQDDWFDAMEIRVATFLCAVALIAFVIRELTAKAPVVNLRLFKDGTFTSATVISFVMYGMLMGSIFLLPVFCQESLHLHGDAVRHRADAAHARDDGGLADRRPDLQPRAPGDRGRRRRDPVRGRLVAAEPHHARDLVDGDDPAAPHGCRGACS